MYGPGPCHEIFSGSVGLGEGRCCPKRFRRWIYQNRRPDITKRPASPPTTPPPTAFDCLKLRDGKDESPEEAEGETAEAAMEVVWVDFTDVDELVFATVVFTTEEVGEGMAVDSVRLASCLASVWSKLSSAVTFR